MSLEETLRSIVREELAKFATDLRPPERRREWLSMTELATELGVGLPVIHSMMKRGCPYVMPDTRPRFHLAQVTAWLEKQRELRNA